MTPEMKTQKAFCEWLKLQHPKMALCIIKIDNESKRTIGGHILAKKCGLKVGASDLFIAFPTDKYHGMWLEIKSDRWKGPGGKKQKLHYENQMNFIEEMNAQGYYATMAVGVDECIKAVNFYLNPKGK